MDINGDRSIGYMLNIQLIGPKRQQNEKSTSRFKTKIKVKDNKNNIYHEIKDTN